MLENGATTLWEHWKFSDSTYSHNHPMFGMVSAWFFKALGGISPCEGTRGFKRFLIKPNLVFPPTDRGITHPELIEDVVRETATVPR